MVQLTDHRRTLLPSSSVDSKQLAEVIQHSINPSREVYSRRPQQRTAHQPPNQPSSPGSATASPDRDRSQAWQLGKDGQRAGTRLPRVVPRAATSLVYILLRHIKAKRHRMRRHRCFFEAPSQNLARGRRPGPCLYVYNTRAPAPPTVPCPCGVASSASASLTAGRRHHSCSAPASVRFLRGGAAMAAGPERYG